MRATVMRNKKLVVADIATPEPGWARRWSRRSPAESADRTCMRSSMRSDWSKGRAVPAVRSSWICKRDIVMGHEFCAEVVDYGPRLKAPL